MLHSYLALIWAERQFGRARAPAAILNDARVELRVDGLLVRAGDFLRGRGLAPVRRGGALHGVTFHSELPPAERGASVIEIVDCRLVLALDDFAAQLVSHDVVEVVHYSMYRPPSARWPVARTATRHPGGLAI